MATITISERGPRAGCRAEKGCLSGGETRGKRPHSRIHPIVCAARKVPLGAISEEKIVFEPKQNVEFRLFQNVCTEPGTYRF